MADPFNSRLDFTRLTPGSSASQPTPKGSLTYEERMKLRLQGIVGRVTQRANNPRRQRDLRLRQHFDSHENNERTWGLKALEVLAGISSEDAQRFGTWAEEWQSHENSFEHGMESLFAGQNKHSPDVTAKIREVAKKAAVWAEQAEAMLALIGGKTRFFDSEEEICNILSDLGAPMADYMGSDIQAPYSLIAPSLLPEPEEELYDDDKGELSRFGYFYLTYDIEQVFSFAEFITDPQWQETIERCLSIADAFLNARQPSLITSFGADMAADVVLSSTLFEGLNYTPRSIWAGIHKHFSAELSVASEAYQNLIPFFIEAQKKGFLGIFQQIENDLLSKYEKYEVFRGYMQQLSDARVNPKDLQSIVLSIPDEGDMRYELIQTLAAAPDLFSLYKDIRNRLTRSDAFSEVLLFCSGEINAESMAARFIKAVTQLSKEKPAYRPAVAVIIDRGEEVYTDKNCEEILRLARLGNGAESLINFYLGFTEAGSTNLASLTLKSGALLLAAQQIIPDPQQAQRRMNNLLSILRNPEDVRIERIEAALAHDSTTQRLKAFDAATLDGSSAPASVYQSVPRARIDWFAVAEADAKLTNIAHVIPEVQVMLDAYGEIGQRAFRRAYIAGPEAMEAFCAQTLVFGQSPVFRSILGSSQLLTAYLEKLESHSEQSSQIMALICSNNEKNEQNELLLIQLAAEMAGTSHKDSPELHAERKLQERKALTNTYQALRYWLLAGDKPATPEKLLFQIEAQAGLENMSPATLQKAQYNRVIVVGGNFICSDQETIRALFPDISEVKLVATNQQRSLKLSQNLDIAESDLVILVATHVSHSHVEIVKPKAQRAGAMFVSYSPKSARNTDGIIDLLREKLFVSPDPRIFGQKGANVPPGP